MPIPPEWQIKAKNKVNKILEDAKDVIKAPIPIKEVIESYLVDVNFITHMDYDFPEGVSAFSTKDMVTGWLIVINGKETLERQRFSAAHELAHIVLFINSQKMVFCSTKGRGWDEDLCDQFAGDLLMPEEMVREWHKSTPTPYVEDIAKLFKVSRPVAEIQLKRLSLPFKSKSQF